MHQQEISSDGRSSIFDIRKKFQVASPNLKCQICTFYYYLFLIHADNRHTDIYTTAKCMIFVFGRRKSVKNLKSEKLATKLYLLSVPCIG